MAAVGIDVRGMAEVQAALRQLGDGPQSRRALQKASTAGARTLKPYVQREAPVGKTGRLRRSISARQARKDRPAAVVSARPKVAFYRHMVIGGTKPHPIVPDERKALAFTAGGRDFVRSRVLHPGIKRPNPFIERGFDAGRAAAEAAIERVIDEFLEAL